MQNSITVSASIPIELSIKMDTLLQKYKMKRSTLITKALLSYVEVEEKTDIVKIREMLLEIKEEINILKIR